MTDEIGNISLEHRRGMRSQLAGVEAKLASYDARLDRLAERLVAVETVTSGLACTLTDSRGELVRQNARIEILEMA